MAPPAKSESDTKTDPPTPIWDAATAADAEMAGTPRDATSPGVVRIEAVAAVWRTWERWFFWLALFLFCCACGVEPT